MNKNTLNHQAKCPFCHVEYGHKCKWDDDRLPNPGEGYRILKPNEILTDTDERWDDTTSWVGTQAAGMKAGPTWLYVYRRKVTPPVTQTSGQAVDPGPGWRLLEPAEMVLAGDEYRGDGKSPLHGPKEWMPASGGRPAGELTTLVFRRKIDSQPVNGANTKSVDEMCGYKSSRPLFEQRAGATIKRVTDTFGQRGSEYGDTMRDCQWLKLLAVTKALGYSIDPKHARAIAIAGMVDIKYQRNQGGYKDDNGVDGIAYDAFLTDEMKELLGGGK